MKKLSSIVWGIVLVIVGVIFALNALNVTDINLFFDGWWTLFIIVPCFAGLITEREKSGNIIGLAAGVVLLLSCQGILDFSLLWKLLVPAIIVILGLKMVFKGVFDNRASDIIKKMRTEGKEPRCGCATFSSCELNYAGETFDGGELTATFGAVKCDLRNAFIENDLVIHASAIFGGIEILVPDNVNVKVNSNSLFGGVSNKTDNHPDSHTIYVNAVCMFGGVEIK